MLHIIQISLIAFTSLLNSLLERMQLAGLWLRGVSNVHNQQLYIFTIIQGIKKQYEEIKSIAFMNIQSRTFAHLGRDVLNSMISSDEVKMKKLALGKIMPIK